MKLHVIYLINGCVQHDYPESPRFNSQILRGSRGRVVFLDAAGKQTGCKLYAHCESIETVPDPTRTGADQ